MRVIAGTYRSRRIAAPPEEVTRPTSDRLRETLFNVISQQVRGSRFLDLYAGSGAVGIEALSRGAEMVYAVESNKKAVRTIEQNLNSLDITDHFELIHSDVATAMKQLSGNQFNIVYVDPPYREHGAYEQAFRLLGELKLLATDAIVIAEHDKHFDPGDAVASLSRYRTLKQGDAVLSFYRQA
jgi:16S rRNA (guanine966-N2)-methyltransferase